MNEYSFALESKIWLTYFQTMECPGNNPLECLFNLINEFGLIALDENKLKRIWMEFIEWYIYVEKLQDSWNTKISDDEWKKIRTLDIGAKYFFTMIEYDLKLEIHWSVKNSKLYKEFFYNAAIYLSIINDIYSLKLDVERNAYKGNYIYVKMRNSNITAEESMALVQKEMNHHCVRTKQLAELLKANRSTDFISYIDAHLDIITGSYYWSISCQRYKI